MSDNMVSENPQDMGGASVQDATKILADMLAPQEDKAEANSEIVEEVFEEEGEVLEDAEIEEPDAELDEDEPDIELDDDEYEPDDVVESAEKFTVKVAGEEVEVDLNELKNGYSRQADYTKKAQALAEDKKAFTQDRDAVLLERQQYAQLLGALQTQLSVDSQQAPDFDRLYEEDPIEAARAERNWTKSQQEKQQKLQAIALEQKRLKDANAKEQETQMRALITAEAEKLTDVIPEWKNKKRADAEREELRQYLTDSGISEDEMGALVRANHISVLRKAMLYDKGRIRVKKAQKASGKRTVKPGASNAQTAPRKRTQKAAIQRLAKTGRRDDAAALLETLL